jgi:hypothetical protein
VVQPGLFLPYALLWHDWQSDASILFTSINTEILESHDTGYSLFGNHFAGDGILMSAGWLFCRHGPDL